jgi:ABC-type branched-subunit amino acid transport system substrate-binding protein
MTFPETLRRSVAWCKHFATNHTGEIVWACLFALVFGWPLARMIDPPKPDITLVVLADHKTHAQTISAFEKAAHEVPLNVGTAPVKIEIYQLQDDNVATAERKARELVARNDVVMVIAHLNSEAVEASLPIYFGEANPKVPVITTVASDDELLSECGKGDKPKCVDQSNFVPLLQLSPINTEQAKWAVAYGTEHSKSHTKRRFMIVYDDSTNGSYARDLSHAYKAAVEDYNERFNEHLVPMGPFSVQAIGKNFGTDKIDCILYAGGIGNVKSMLAHVPKSDLPPMVILSDSAVERSISEEEDELGGTLRPINFTYQTDAVDYNQHTNAFSQDSIAIARRLIGDLNERGLSLRYKLKALFGLETGADVRRDLVKVMKLNAQFRTAYEGAQEVGIEGVTHPVYVFEDHKRVNGMFHVWRLDETGQSGPEMKDVDGWHPKRLIITTGTSGQQVAAVSDPSSP